MSNQTEHIQKQIEELNPWFHNLHLPCGLQTSPDHFLGDFPSYKWREISPHLPKDMTGWRILDIGCNAGFYCFELVRRGAEVIGIDSDPHYLKQARRAAEWMNLADKVEFQQMQVYDLAHHREQYDLVVFMGVFYHLRYPLLGLDLAARKVKRWMLFQTMTLPGEEPYQPLYDCRLDQKELLCQRGWPKMAFIENRLANDPTNWWVANHACIEGMLRTTGLKIIARPGEEIYLCESMPELPSNAMNWNYNELLSATGQLRTTVFDQP